MTFSSPPHRVLLWANQRIDSAGDALIDLRVERPSLEERFME